MPSGVKDSLQHGDVRFAEEEVTQIHTQTHTHTHTHTHTLPTTTDHHTAAIHKTKSQLCDGIQCRQTARTAGSAKGEILAVQLGKGETE